MLNRIIEFEWKMLFPVFCLFFVRSAQIKWKREHTHTQNQEIQSFWMNSVECGILFGCHHDWLPIQFLQQHFLTMDNNNSKVKSIQIVFRFLMSFNSFCRSIIRFDSIRFDFIWIVLWIFLHLFWSVARQNDEKCQ